jgi:hypothetical protein
MFGPGADPSCTKDSEDFQPVYVVFDGRVKLELTPKDVARVAAYKFRYDRLGTYYITLR